MNGAKLSDNDESDKLREALAASGIELPLPQIGLLDCFRAALWSANERLNLTRHTDYETFVTRDVVDSLALAEHVPRDASVLDIGSGGGVPGVVLAVVRPDLSVELSESVGKRAKALGEIVAATGLSLPIHQARAEDLLADRRFEVLVARAVAPLTKLLKWLAPHRTAFERLLLIKGARWTEERGEARHKGLLQDYDLRKPGEYQRPGTEIVNVVLELVPRK